MNCLGHCPPEITQALALQGQQLISPSPALHNRPQLDLADRLAKLSGLSQVHFASSGAEANEAAVKLARKWGRLHRGGAYGVITATNAFHGRTLAMMAASGKAGWDELFPPNPPGFRKVPFGDVDAMRSAIDDTSVAVMVEPIQGEAGVVVPPADYLAQIRALADDHNLLVIYDEVQTGIGRTGTLFGFQHDGLAPDIMTLGKGLGGGVPLSAVLANDRAACFEHGDHGGTYNGNPLMTAVGNAVLDVVADDGFLDNVRRLGISMQRGLEVLGARHDGVEVRGRGLLWALKLASPRAVDVSDKALASSLIVNAARPDVLRFMPSLRVTDAELDAFFALLDASLG